MTKKKIWLTIAAAILLALAFFGGCKYNQKSGNPCANCEVKEVIKYIHDSIPVVREHIVTSKPQKEYVKVPTTDEDKERLIDSLTERLVYFQSVADAKAAELELIRNAPAGTTVETILPYLEANGEVTNQDSTVKVRWRVKYLGELKKPTKEEPNPIFDIDRKDVKQFVDVDKTKPNAIGVGGMLRTDGKDFDVAPVLNLRVKNVTGYFGYYVIDKQFTVGLTNERAFGKKKS